MRDLEATSRPLTTKLRCWRLLFDDLADSGDIERLAKDVFGRLQRNLPDLYDQGIIVGQVYAQMCRSIGLPPNSHEKLVESIQKLGDRQ